MVMKELHEGPLGGHFLQLKKHREKYWMLDIVLTNRRSTQVQT